MLTTAQIEQEKIQNALVISDNDNTESDSDNSDFTSDSDDFSDNLSDYDQSIQDRKQSKLRPHQQEALDFMKSNNTGVMQLFCGTGKSRIMYDFMIKQIKKYKKYNTLIVIPSLPLIQQFNQSYLEDITNTQQREINGIRLNKHIIDSDNYSTLQPEHLAKDANLVIISYASLDKLKDHIHHFNLIMFDEAHHIVTKKKIAFIQQIPNAKVFYFTATPKIDKKLLNMYENDATNPINCGQVFKYDFRTAVQDQWVVDYQLNFCIYKQIQDQPDSSNNKDQFNALVQFAEIHKRTRIIAFNQYINKTSDVKTNSLAFADLGTDKVQIQTICGTTNPDDRKLIFDWFQQDDYSTTKIIFNASCIKEGIDLPCADLIVFCDDKQSPIQIVQCIGRGTRLSNNKQNALITAMIPQSDKCEFKIITNICKALKDSDTQMRDIMDKQRLAEFIKFTNCTREINPANSVVYKDFTDKIVVALTQQDRYHYDRLDRIVEYYKNNNKLPSQQDKDKEIRRMAIWLCHRKSDYKKDKLDKDLKKIIETKLKDYGFEWEVDQLQEHFNKLDVIIKYCQHSKILPINHSKNVEIASMARWLGQRKIHYTHNTLNKDLQKAIEDNLQDYGFMWNQLSYHFKKLDDVFKYCQKSKKLPQARSKDEEIAQLGTWLRARKDNQQNGKLDKDLKIAIENKLNEFGFSWTVNYLHFKKLDGVLEYCQRNNKLPSQYDKDKEIRSMGQWLSNRKSDYKGQFDKNKKQKNIDKDLALAIENKLKNFGFKWEGNKGVTQSIAIISPSIIKDMHQVAFTSNIDTLYNRFKNNPVELINYHKQREFNQSQKQPDHLPHNIVIKELKSLKFKGNRAVIDLGCGLNKIADEFKESTQFTFTSIDFQIMEQSKGIVQQGDISNLPQYEDSSYWCAIMSLCFWGKDFINSIKECNRLLEDSSLLYIVQTNKKMEGFVEIIKQCGFVISKQTIIDKYTLIKCKKE